MNTDWWSGFFKLAALFNVAVALPLLIAPQLVTLLLGDGSFDHPPLIQLLAWFVLAFGVGYWLIAREPVRNRDIAALGACGKLGVVAIAWISFAAGSAPLPFALLTLADVLWAIWFLRFYRASA